MCLVFFTPAIGISCMYIGCGVAILLLSLVRHINIGTEEDWWKGYEIYFIGGFIFSLYFSIRTIISVWKKVLSKAASASLPVLMEVAKETAMSYFLG